MLHSDSRVAIEALDSYEVGKNNKVPLVWIPDYLGIKGNEEAITLATKRAQTPVTGPESFCGIDKGSYKTEISEKAES